MEDWMTNPLVWIGAITALLVVGRVVFQIGQWKGKVDEQVLSVQAFMEEIRTDIKRIFERLPAPAPILSDSPLRLSDLGHSISRTLDASVWAERKAASLAERVAGMSAYDIQELSFSYVAEDYEPDEKMDAKIKQCAYEHGLKRRQVLDVLAIELRDALMNRHSGDAP